MKVFLIIIKSKEEEIKGYKKDLSHIFEKNGKKYHTVELYNIIRKYIVETAEVKNVYEHYAIEELKIVNIKELDPKKDNRDSGKLTLGDLFKDHFVEYTDKYCDKPYLNVKSKKVIKKLLVKTFDKEYVEK
jgi:hypothetical protein